MCGVDGTSCGIETARLEESPKVVSSCRVIARLLSVLGEPTSSVGF